MAVDLRVTNLQVQVGSNDASEVRATQLLVQIGSNDASPIRVSQLFVQVGSDTDLDTPDNNRVRLVVSEGADTFAGDVLGGLDVSVAATEGADTFAGTVEVPTFADLDATEGADTFEATVSNVTAVDLLATEGPDTLAAEVSVVVVVPRPVRQPTVKTKTTSVKTLVNALEGPPSVIEPGYVFSHGRHVPTKRK